MPRSSAVVLNVIFGSNRLDNVLRIILSMDGEDEQDCVGRDATRLPMSGVRGEGQTNRKIQGAQENEFLRLCQSPTSSDWFLACRLQ